MTDLLKVPTFLLNQSYYHLNCLVVDVIYATELQMVECFAVQN